MGSTTEAFLTLSRVYLLGAGARTPLDALPHPAARLPAHRSPANAARTRRPRVERVIARQPR